VSLGLYVHIPFCASICNYCNFNRGLFDAALKLRYVDALRHEIARAADGTPVDTVFFGGGTPSLLEPEEVAAVLQSCRDAFLLSGQAEITLEANPETVSEARLAAYRAAGINRLSFGVQSFRDDELIRLSRRHSSSRAVDVVGEARRAGFDNVSLDLMMWLPQQSVSSWLESVQRLIDLDPDHASLYLLELYPNAPLKEEMARSHWSLAPDDDAADMYLQALDTLDRAGYEQYEISNVTRPGRMSRHNLKYWQDGDWQGFGCGAHSTRNGVRWKNLAATAEYVDAVTAGQPVVVDRRILSPRERFEDAMFTGLRLNAGVDTQLINERYNVDAWQEYGNQLASFTEAGILIYDGARLRLTRPGMLLANEVMAVFIDSTVR
jgi:oxygen-independent coproporphyrinogen-3 oxidase